MKKSLVVLFCAPLRDYPEQPKDYSKSRLIQCPYCAEKMWLSEKKEIIFNQANDNGNDIILACFHCLIKIAHENPELKDHIRVDI